MNHITKLATMVDQPAKYWFPIKSIPMQGIFNDEGIIHDIDCPDKQMIIRTDTNEYMGSHSLQYRPVTHDRIIDPVRGIMMELDSDYIFQVQLLESGSMMEARLISKNISFKDPAQQDYIAFQIVLRNSYNGMWSVMIEANGLRLWCLNGCTTADKIAYYRQKHNGIFNYQFNHIKESVSLFKNNEQRYRDWYNTKVTQDDADRLFSALTYTPKPTVDGKYRNETQYVNLLHHWSDYQHSIGTNKWGLYNAVTHWISHPQNVSSTNKTVVERNSKMLNYMSKSDSIFN